MKNYQTLFSLVLAVFLLISPSVATAQDAGNEIPLPVKPKAHSIRTSGKIVKILVEDTRGFFHFRVTKMPKEILWFQATNNRTIAVIQQAASKNWQVYVWHDRKGVVELVLSIIDHKNK